MSASNIESGTSKKVERRMKATAAVAIVLSLAAAGGAAVMVLAEGGRTAMTREPIKVAQAPQAESKMERQDGRERGDAQRGERRGMRPGLGADLNAFFQLPEGEERQKFLDKVIDEQESRMKAFAERGSDREPERGAERGTWQHGEPEAERVGGARPRPSTQAAAEREGRHGPATRPGRREGLAGNPQEGQGSGFRPGRMAMRGEEPSDEQRERIMQFVQEMQKRRVERGLPTNPPPFQRRG